MLPRTADRSPPADGDDFGVPEVKKCHLHKKANKACKFCKAYGMYAEIIEKKKEERKKATLEELQKDAKVGQTFAATDKALTPNFAGFPRVFAERIKKTEVYINYCQEAQLEELIDILAKCDNCDTERKSRITLDFQPSVFISAIYRLLTIPMTEGDIISMMNYEAAYVRCAAFLYVRLGFHVDRYWDSLSEHLMDDTEFKPFSTRGGESLTMTVGEFVENLLVKLEYGETETKLALPRIPVAQRTMMNRRLCLYPQFRKRYAANLDQIDALREGVEVEVCSADGLWRKATIRDNLSHRSLRCATVTVSFLDGGASEHVSIGKLIVPGRSRSRSRSKGASQSSDLTKSRGVSAQDILKRYDSDQKGQAVSRGKDYCKMSSQDVNAGGHRVVVGMKRGRPKREEVDDDEDSYDESRAIRRRQEEMENRARLAAIESKYCARVQTQSSTPLGDTMRLG